MNKLKSCSLNRTQPSGQKFGRPVFYVFGRLDWAVRTSLLLTQFTGKFTKCIRNSSVLEANKHFKEVFEEVNLVPDRYRKVAGGMEHAQQIVQHDAMLSHRRNHSDCRSIVWQTFFSTIQIFVSEI